ncbi:unnamed protein product [Larinioides sclopetarius]|uniref:Mos1 transposase HTH domain-containing protein n=1 Tax=Larinioides sclopetarius TaxID=280406 RepID=A0AAV2BLK0_9ARAC
MRSPFSAYVPGSYICWEATDDITEPSDRVYICLRAFKMPPPIENPADCVVGAVIRFLSTKGFKTADIHRQVSDVYGENIMSAGMVRKWVRGFKDGRTNIHDEERRWRPSVITDDLIQKVDSKVKKNRRCTISSLSEEFPISYNKKKHFYVAFRRNLMSSVISKLVLIRNSATKYPQLSGRNRQLDNRETVARCADVGCNVRHILDGIQ